MASSNTSTFDQSTPHRPGLDELGGGQKKDHPVEALRPDPLSMATAADFNQLSQQAQAAGRMMALAYVWVGFSSGVPHVVQVVAPGNNVTVDDFDLVDEGDGVTLVKWTSGLDGKLPTAVGVKPFQTDDQEIDRIRAILTAVSGQPAARVRTKLATTGVNANFVLEIF